MQKFSAMSADIKSHLADNSGDENVSKMIWIIVVFVVGGILLALITGAFNNEISSWFKNTVTSWFSTANGSYKVEASTVAPTAPAGA